MRIVIQSALLAGCGLAALAQPAFANVVTAAAADASSGDAGAAAEGDQSTTANQAGQANDKGALSTSDIIVTGSHQAEVAPITASLTTTQPQSAINREFIDNSVATADFFELITMTPGVTITGTGNGAGFSESKAQIRGFQDGEYNVTYDSIPFADTNNPTHHSTAFFPSNTIETVVVDRGPGNASQLGQATYGGNINIYSRAVKDEQGGQIEGIYGSFNSFIARAEYQSGKIASMNDARFVIAAQYLRSDGALTFSPVESKNIFAKGVIPIGSHNTLTVLATYNRNHYFQSDTARGTTCGSATAGVAAGSIAAGSPAFTLAALNASGQLLTQLNADNCAPTSLVAKVGIDYGMNNDPTTADYYQYNRTDKTTDFSIIRLQSDLGSGFSMDNRLYTYAYVNNTMSGNGTTTAAAPATIGGVPTINTGRGTIVTGFAGLGAPASPFTAINSTTATDVSGYDKGNKYRTMGYIGQLNYDFSMGKIRLGVWYENASTDRRLLNLNIVTGAINYNQAFNNGSGTAAANALPDKSIANISYVQHSGWNQYQLFGEFEFHPMESLSITPGIKYVHFTRSIDAVVNQTSRTPNNSSASWKKTLPFATVNWAATPNWSFYGQYAQGMYVPDLSSFYSPSGSAASQANQAQTLATLQPQTTTNYQIGTVWHGSNVSIDLDAYSIEVNNKIAASTNAADPPNTLVNIGRVKYKGIEGNISFMPVKGLTLFANAGLNDAKSAITGRQISRAAKYNAGLGAVYNHNGLRISFMQKFTGPAYATEYANATGTTSTSNPTSGERLYRIAPYSVGDFAMSKEFGGHIRVGVTVSNVFNNRAITAISASSSGAPTTALNGVTYQVGYGQLDAFNFLPPRSFQADLRFKF